MGFFASREATFEHGGLIYKYICLPAPLLLIRILMPLEGLQFCWVSGSQLRCQGVILSGNKVASGPWERRKTIDSWKQKHILKSKVYFWQWTRSFLIAFVIVAMKKLWEFYRRPKKENRAQQQQQQELDVIYFGIILKSRLFFVCHTVGSLVQDVDPIR